MNHPNRDMSVPTTLGSLAVHDSGPADGDVALLWPSLFSDGQTSWGGQLAGLHELGWRTLLVEPPGTGSSAPASRLFTMEECAEAAIQILDAACADRAAFLGLSWGGFVGLRVALAAPRRVTALVLSNTSARRMTFVQRQRSRLEANLVRIGVPGGVGRLVAAAMLSDHSRRTYPALAKRFAHGVDSLDAASLSRAMRSVLVNRTSVVNVLHRITAPTLVIVGGEDQALPRIHSEELADHIPGARLEVLPRVGHLAPWEAPSAVAALLAQFLTPQGTHKS
ncbi:alpha/beta fold hydrolase [Nocardia sp. NPDC052278]|uniref:alpha/beta fold hydrolase n=1 Tax=unclassified Nocardia TaxID=2637762 RepID=UPI0036C67BB3